MPPLKLHWQAYVVHCIRLVTLVLVVAVVVCTIGLHSGQTQSTGLRRITNTSEEAININPSISGDGRIIAFESTEDLAGVRGGEHFRAIRADITVDPASFLQIGGTRAVTPSVSQDGSRIAFASKDDPLGTNADGNSEIFLFDGARLSQITNTLPGSLANRITNGNFQPSISDDGRFIAFSSNRDLAGQNTDGNLEIFVYDAAGGGFTQLTNSSGTVGFTDAKISGNGAFVVYIRDNGLTPGATRDLIEQPRLGGGGANVLAAAVPSLTMTYGRAISDDGTRVVYSSQTATNASQVFLYDRRSGAGIRQITSLGARVTEVPLHPSISGDGTRISFATRRNVNGGNSDGSVELYLYDLPTATFSRITNAPSSATAEVVSSLNDDGSVAAFNFPRVLSGAVTNADLANDSEIYTTGTPARPPFGSLTIVNAASLSNEPSTTKAVAPDSIAVARGGLLANSTQQSGRLSNGSFPTTVGGTSVTVNGRPAQIFFISPNQVNFLLPAETEIGVADVVVTNSEGFPSRGSIATLPSAPGLFTKSGDGTGEALVLNSDTLQEGPFDPSDGKLRLTFFATGARNATPLSVTIGGQVITPELTTPSPDMPGLDEIHVRAPASLKGAGVVTISAQGDGRDTNPSNTRFVGGDILINEVLADPPGAAPADLIGDANRDGVRSSSDDEFVELVNSTSHDIDISGYQLFTRSSGAANDTLRHTLSAGTILFARTAAVIFGGGAPNSSDPAFGGALIGKASTGGLSLSNTAGTVTLRDSNGAVANIFEFGGATGLSAGSNQSLTRSPDISGAFTGHPSAAGAGGRLFSPGTRVDGTPFLTIAIARIDLSPLSPTIDAGAKQQFTARALDAANQEMSGVIFSWQSSNTSVATIDQTGLATSSTAGTTQVTASARGVQSAPAALTVRAVQRVPTRVDVTPNPATIPATGAQQFTAKGSDQFGNEIAGLTFTWESTVTSVATIDQNGLAKGVSHGQSTIKATTQSVTGSAVINVTPPTLVVNEVLADPPAGTEGDANHDGIRDGAQDEFVELVNSTNSSIDISGWTLRTHSITSTTETVRHTFAAASSVPAGEAFVLFGGGTFDPANPLFGCAQVVTASSGGLSLTNGGLTILIRDGTGKLVTEFSYGGSTGLNGGNAQSMTRSPDVTGSFALHTTPAAASGRKFSAGLKLDGTPFGNCPGHPASVTVSPSATSANAGESTTFTAQAFDQFGRVMIGVPITFASDSTAVATIDSTTRNPLTGVVTASVGARNPGVAHISASANDGTTTANSNQATLTVTGPALSINDVTANEGNAGTTTFTFTVSSSLPAPAGGITFDIATANGTATSASGDYVTRSLTGQTIPAGQSSFTFEVTVDGDLLVEPNETFFVNISNVSANASIGDGQGSGTIQNDDAPVIVISQLYGGGGNAGATFKNDFIEIYNRGTTTVDLAGWSVQYTSATGTSNWSVTPLCPTGPCLIQPGRYFLVQEDQGSGGTQDLPAPDAIGTIAMTTSAGKVAVTSSTTPLSGGCPSGAGILDIVGYGSSASCFEGSGPAGAPGNATADFRKAGGCVDTNDNPNDFFVAQPNPRNSASLIGDCKPEITINDVTSTENNSGTINATFTVNLAAASAQAVTVEFATADGTATAPADYQTNNGTLTFNPGDLTKTITVLVNGDTLDEAGETFFVNLSNATNAVILDNQGQGTINDNDPAPSLSINDVTVAEGDSGNDTATFTVSLSSASGQTVTVNYTTADNTAASGSDYQSASGALTFNPGDTSKPVLVTVNGDTTFEQNETFFVNLSGATNASISDNQGIGTITNDDAAPPTPTFFITNATVTEGNSGTMSAVFDVSLTPASSQVVQVEYVTVNGAATVAGNDYQSSTGTLIFNPSDGPKQITVLVNGDTLVETDETFTVHLSNATNGAAIGTPDGTGTIQNDDTADLVISQTYPGGGLSGATFTHDYIELFNQGATTVDFAVTPYSVQFLSTSASTWAKTDLTSGTLAPGRYFLIQGTSGANGVALPTPDATGSLNLTSTMAGKVALVSGTTLLAGNCPGDDGSAPFNPVDGTVVDFVGYGGTAATANHCYEGTGPASYTLGNNTTADFRKFGGCQRTNDNTDDFVALTPTPRNTSSPVNDCTAADLEITKTDSPDPVIVGSNVTYTITVTNHGPANANSVVVTDNLPANVTFVSCSSTGAGVCAGSGNNRTVSYASLAAGASETITLIATANGPAGTQITNTASVTSSTTDPASGNNSAMATTDVNNPNFADLSISKSDSIDPVAPGNTLTYTITLTNNGPDAAQSVVVTDSLPSDVTFVDCSSNQGGVCGGPATTPTVSFASLASGATATITIRVTVSSSLSTGAVLSNTATVTAGSVDSVSSNDSETETTNVQAVNAGDIVFSEVRFHGSAGASDDFVELNNPTTRAIDISGFKLFRSNASGTKTLHLTINSNVILPAGCHYLLTNTAYDDGVAGDQTYGTSITDDGGVAITLPSGTDSTGILDQVGLSSGSAYKEGTPLTALTTNVDRSYERKPGGSFGNGTDTNDNSADFVLNPSSSNPQNSSTGCLNTSSADLSITKADSPDPVTIGSNITHTITVLNNGAATAQNVLVTDNLPAEVTFVSCGATGGAICGGSGNNRTVTLTSLPSGSSFTATIVATANGPHGSTATNTASVSSTTTDANSSNDNATATTLMQEPTPSLSIDDVTLTEGTGGTTNFVFTVTLTPSSSQTVTVNYATSSISPATAVAGTDYTSTTGMLTFTPSDTSEQITVQVTGDSANEAICETFFVKLSSPVNATIYDDTGQGGITDDDGTKLVISQVYGGGGNGGATYSHDFIEIFNRGNTTVSLAGWSVQYAAAASTTWSATNLTGSIAPGKYYLIQENSGGAAGVALPTPDAIGSITMAAGAGKVALVNSTTALSGACPSSSSFIDLIGYGTTANCFEGSGVAPTPSATLSDQRAVAGCTDVGNNTTDFATATPAARNSATAAAPCSCSTSYSSFFSFANEWLNGSLARVIDRDRAFP